MAAMTTGIFGGIIRDILCNRVPVVFRHELYASVSLLVAVLYLLLRKLGVGHDLNMLASFAIGLTIRLCAIRWSWSLPVFSYAPDRWRCAGPPTIGSFTYGHRYNSEYAEPNPPPRLELTVNH